MPPGSCLILFVQEEGHSDAPSPILSETKIHEPFLKDEAVSYQMSFLPPANGFYTLHAVINLGWCKSDGDWIRPGDYINEFAVKFLVLPAKKSIKKDFTVMRLEVPGSSL